MALRALREYTSANESTVVAEFLIFSIGHRGAVRNFERVAEGIERS
jgi:hypothetical protein